MKKILLYGLSVRSSKGTSWIPVKKWSQLEHLQACNDVRCSPLVSTPNVNNFLDIRSQRKGLLATSECFFSNSMFILKIL